VADKLDSYKIIVHTARSAGAFTWRAATIAEIKRLVADLTVNGAWVQPYRGSDYWRFFPAATITEVEVGLLGEEASETPSEAS